MMEVVGGGWMLEFGGITEGPEETFGNDGLFIILILGSVSLFKIKTYQ